MVHETSRREDLQARLEQNLALFIIRARRVGAHSLADLRLLEDLRTSSLTVAGTGANQILIIDLPPEEQMESLAARVRPVLLASESTHWRKALEAIGFLAPQLNPRARHVLGTLKKSWNLIDDKGMDARGYSVQSRDADGQKREASDNALAWAWFYGDVVHADVERLAVVDGFDIFERYRAACAFVAEAAFLTLATLNLIEGLSQEGALAVDRGAFTVEVTVTETRRERPVTVHTAPVGTPLPRDIDGTLGPSWTRLGDVAVGDQEVTP